MIRSFGSDNHSGIHPQILESIIRVNRDHALAYGADELTQKVSYEFKKVFGQSSRAFFVTNGTAANVLGLKSITQSHHIILCSEYAHIHQNELGAAENWIGCKLQPIQSLHGKITPESMMDYFKRGNFKHFPRLRVLSITQPTELGAVYSLEEIKVLTNLAHEKGLYVHMDGARLSNAAAHLDCSFQEMTTDCGVDILSLGGTKNGLMLGDAIVFFGLESFSSETFNYIQHQSLQLPSKMRFIAAQFEAYFRDELWRKNALHSNQMAHILAEELAQFSQIKITHPVQSNVVFATLPEAMIEPLQRKFYFYLWNQAISEVRWMTTFDTTLEDIQALREHIQLINQIL